MKKSSCILILSCFMLLTLNAQSKREKYIDLVNRFADAYMDADLKTISEIVHKDYKYYFFGTYEMGYDDLINRIKEKKAEGGHRVDAHEWVVEGDKVASNWTAYFTDAVFKGTIKFKGILRIDGKFQGDILSQGTLYIGKTGSKC